MTEYFIQFAASETVPFIAEDKGYYMLNPGNCLTSGMALFTPVPVKGIRKQHTCVRFRTVVRGKWSPRGHSEEIVAYLTKNRAVIPESKMTFHASGAFDAVTRHRTTFPNVKFEHWDTIGVSLIVSNLKFRVKDFYVSAIANFEHA